MRTVDMINKKILGWIKVISFSFIICHLSFSLSACSENTDESQEYADWQLRNDVFFDSLEDSLAAAPAVWKKFKSYAKDQSLAKGENTDCIYVKVLETGTDTENPMATDSVRVSYEGRLIPSATYPNGYVFDTRAYGTYELSTSATSRFLASNNIEGFTTALLHMHRGDQWRVYIPYALGYGATQSNKIPAYSTLIFQMSLIDFAPVGTVMPAWN